MSAYQSTHGYDVPQVDAPRWGWTSPSELRDRMPFQPAVIGEGTAWGGLVVEYYDAQPPTEMNVPPHEHHQINVSLSNEKAHRQWCGERRFGTFHDGEVAVISAGNPVTWIWPEGAAPCVHIHLPHAVLCDTAARVDTDPGSFDVLGCLGGYDPSIQRLAITLLTELHNPSFGRRVYVDSLAILLCVEVLRNHVSKEGVDDDSLPDKGAFDLKQLLEYIHENLYENMSLADLASVAGLSPYYFSRCFKEAIGNSPHQYIIAKRVEHAIDRLRDPQDETSLAQIAFDLGFYDQAHFSKHFKRAVGVTPGQYRSKARTY